MKIRHINTIIFKEFHTYFNSSLGYIFLAVFLAVSSGLYFNDFFLANQSSMRVFFSALPWFFLFLVPAITMRLWAEEKKMGTLECLMTSPVTTAEAVAGKFLASFLFLLLALTLSGVIPLTLFFIGQPDWGAIAGGYLGAVFLGASYLALGLFISSLTDNQIIAFIVSVLLIFLLLAAGEDAALQTMPKAIVPFVQYIAIGLHFESVARGVIDSRDLVYYAAFVLLFLYLNVASLNHRKWR